MTIVYVDDDPDDIDMLRDVFMQLDATISFISYTEGSEALEFLSQTITLPDFVFVDINMPVMDGRHILRYIKQDKRLQSIPVIMYSTSNSQKEVSSLYQDGALLYLQKASTVKAMEDTISFFLMNVKTS